MNKFISRKIGVMAFAAFAAVLFFAGANNVFAAVTVTAATGGSAISADTNTTNGTATWTTLTGPTVTETTGRAISTGSGTIVLTAPTGFSYNTGATVTATITRNSGAGTCFTFSSNTATPTASSITYTITARDSNGSTDCKATFSNIQVRPTAGTPLASGNVTNTGSNAQVPSGAGNNYGTLTEVAGAKNKLIYTTQPTSTATTNVNFAANPVIALEDQYGNTEISDSASTVSLAAVLSTQACGGTAGTGTLTSTPASGAAVTAGVMTYTAMKYSFGESIKICATSSGVTSALSNTVAVSNPVPTTTSISPASTTAGGVNFTLTVNGTNFVSNSSVDINNASRTTIFASSTQLTATILASDIAVGATSSITVVNPTPGGGTSNAQTFTINNPAPVLAAISPTSTTAGSSGFTLTLIGTNFNASSSAKWNGSSRTTVFVSSTTLQATILTSDLTTPTTSAITVTNPTPGGGTSATQTFTVAKAPTSISVNSSATSSVYGNSVTFTATVATSSAGQPSGTITFKDGVSTLGTATLNGANPDVATFSTSTLSVSGSPHSITAVYGGDSNFAASTSSAISQIITTKTLTVSGITAQNKTYDASTTATLLGTPGTLVGVVGSDSVSLAGTAVGIFATSSVGSNILVTVSGQSLTGAQSSNYSLTEPSTSANITAKNLIVTGITANSKVYDASTTATLNTGSATLVGVIAGDTVTLNTGSALGTFTTSSVGSGITVQVAGLTISGSSSSNYSLTEPSTSANITTKSLTVSGITAQNKTYDASTTATLLGTPGTLVGVVGSDSVSLAGTAVGIFATSSVGSNILVTVSGQSLTGAQSSNYSLTEPSTSANITAKNLIVTGITANSKVYDASTTATLNTGSATLVGVIAGDTVTLNTGSALGTFTTSSVGSGITVQVAGLTISGSSSSNYSLTEPSTSANITTKSLTVSGITAQNKTYDASTTATLLGTPGTLVGVVGSDSVSLAGTAVGIFATSSVGSNILVTVSGQSLTGAQSSNYSLTEPSTSANITAKNLIVTGITANSKVYDASTTATLNTGSATLVGVIAGDTVTLNTGSALGTFTTSSVGSGITVQVAGLTISGSSSSNYSLTEPSTSANITTKSLTVSGITANDKTYDGNTTATLNTGSAVLVGVVSGDTVTLNTGGAVGTFATSSVGTGIFVTISGLTISGPSSGNYSLTQPTTTASITNPVPTTTSISPTSTTAGSSGFTLTVNGTNFVSGSVVNFNGVAKATTFVSSSTVTAAILASDVATVGSYPVTVTNSAPGGGTSNSQTFTVLSSAPILSSISPTSTTAGGAQFTLTLNGSNFLASSTADWNGSPLSTTFISSTTLTAIVPATDIATAGTASVTVATPAPGGGTSGAQTFTINNPIPTATSLSPTSTDAGSSGFTLTINGTNFVSGSVVDWNGSARITSFVSANQLTATILTADVASTGTASVTVVNGTPGGGTSNAQTFTITTPQNPAPTLSALSPTSTIVGSGGFTLTLTGTNFISSSTVEWNGGPRVTTFVSSTTITAAILGSDVATAGTASVTITNPAPGGGTSGTQTFTILNPVPATTSLSPTSVAAGSPDFTLTVNGTNFIAGSVVDWNGLSRSTTFVSSTQLTATILAADVVATGTASVTVVNATPGGGTSNAQTFTITAALNPVPTVTSLSPTSAIAGGSGFTLTVIGTNFVGNSTVEWNGSSRTTTFISSSTVTALITAADIATAGTSSITVFNPVPGGGTSGSSVFTVNPAPLGAIKFIFANVTSSAVVGNNVTFNIEAVTASSTVDTSFQQGVTLTVGGSGSGGGLVSIVNGVGTSTASDNVAETVALGLQDSQSTGLDVSAVAHVTFTPGPVARFALNHPGNMNGGTRLGYTVGREDQFGNFVSVGGTPVYLYTNSTSSNAAFWNAAAGGTQVTSTLISGGSTSTTFWYYDDTFGSRTVTASDNAVAPDGAAGVADASDAFSVAPGAVKFVFANVPPSETVGSAATVNVEAVDSLGNIDPSYASGVTVTMSGSATGGGLVNLVGGVGTTTINDAAAETVTLGFHDTQSTGLGAAATSQIVFNPAPVAPPVSPSGGGLPLTSVPFGIKPGVTITFSGRAYPGATVKVIRKDLGLQAVPVAQTVAAAADGSFLVELDNVTRLTGQTYLLSFVDRNGLIAQTKAYNIPAQDKIVYGNILAAPTLGFQTASVIAKGIPLILTGYATPRATVELFVDGNAAGTVLINDPSGKYAYALDTDTLGFGRHSVWAIQKNAQSVTQISGYTNSLSNDEIFIDDATNGILITKSATSGLYAFVPALTGGTGGGVLPVVVGQMYTKQAESDFSNQQSFTVSPLANPKLDLNGDGVIDIRDLSIFLAYLKNLNASMTNFHIVDPTLVKVLDFNGDGIVDAGDLNILVAAIIHP